MYFRELVFWKPRLSNSSANLSSPSPCEIECNQRKTSDLASDMFQEVTQMICTGTVSKNSLTNENLAFAFPRALTNWQCNIQILFLTFEIQVTCNSLGEASVTQSTGFSVSYMKHPTTWNYCHFIFYHWYFYNFILLLYHYMWHRFDLDFFFDKQGMK